jgi:hypothetical protein
MEVVAIPALLQPPMPQRARKVLRFASCNTSSCAAHYNVVKRQILPLTRGITVDVSISAVPRQKNQKNRKSHCNR